MACMNRSATYIPAAAILASAIFATSATAQDNKQVPGYQKKNDLFLGEDTSDWSVMLGAGGAFGPAAYGSRDDSFIAGPFLDITYKDTVFLNTEYGLGFYAVDTDNTTVAVALSYGEGRSEEDDPRLLRGLGDIDGGVVLQAYGSQLLWNVMEVSIDVTRNFGDADGFRAGLSAATGYPLSENLFLGFEASLEWADKNHMQAFFGVTPEQAAARQALLATDPRLSSISAFEADSGIADVSLETSLSYSFGDDDEWFAVLGGGISMLQGDAKRSPITERNTAPYGYFAVGYIF